MCTTMLRSMWFLLLILFVGRAESFSTTHSLNRSSGIIILNARDVSSFPTKRNARQSLYSKSTEDADSSSFLTSVSTPLDRPLLAAIDVAALTVFSAVGKASHSADGSLDILAVATVAFPFAASWLVTSPFTGIFAPDDRSDNLVKDVFFKTAKGWIFAIPLGCVLRGVIKGYAPPIPFVIVTMIATLVILSGCRILFSLMEDSFVER
jgi:hypothetical protein